MKFDFDDILIEPAIISDIESRSEIDIFDENDMLPLMTAPMDTVINKDNFDYFIDNGIYAVLTRTKENPELSYDLNKWMSYSLDQFEQIFIKDKIKLEKTVYVLIDTANGHMQRLVDLIKESKDYYGNLLCLMVGNIGNPQTFKILSEAGADYIRVGIGNGCFIPEMEVLTINGMKKIKDINIGDKVLTHVGKYQDVLEKYEYERDEEILIINNIECTKNHEFYVIDKKYKDIVNDDNINQYAKWISAENLTKNHLLIEYENFL